MNIDSSYIMCVQSRKSLKVSLMELKKKKTAKKQRKAPSFHINAIKLSHFLVQVKSKVLHPTSSFQAGIRGSYT